MLPLFLWLQRPDNFPVTLRGSRTGGVSSSSLPPQCRHGPSFSTRVSPTRESFDLPTSHRLRVVFRHPIPAPFPVVWCLVSPGPSLSPARGTSFLF